MIVQCSACQTRFRLPDEKIKPEGTRVRCSRCKHVFLIQTEPAPEAAAAVATPAPARPEPAAGYSAAATGGMPSPPPAAESGGQEDTSFDFDDAPAGTDPAPEESYSFDAPSPSLDFAADGTGGSLFDEPAAEAGKDLSESAGSFSFEEPADAPTGFSFDEPAADTGAGAFDFEEEGAESTFGEKGGGTIAFEEDEFSLESNTASGWDGSEDAADEFSFTEHRPAAKEGDEFDFSNITFGEEAPPSPGASVSAAAPAALGASLEPASPPLRPERPAPPDYDDFVSPPLAAPPLRRSRRSPASGVLTFVLLFLLILSAAGGYFIWQRGEIPDLAALTARLTGNLAPAAPVGQIRVADLNGYFASNSEAGQLFVIQGKAVNEYKEARSAIAVKGVLYGKGGEALLQQTVFTGNPLDDAALQSLPFSRIEESMNNQFGDSLSNLNVAPGKTIPFTIVFKNLPPDLAEFTVEVTDSRPGSS